MTVDVTNIVFYPGRKIPGSLYSYAGSQDSFPEFLQDTRGSLLMLYWSYWKVWYHMTSDLHMGHDTMATSPEQQQQVAGTMDGMEHHGWSAYSLEVRRALPCSYYVTSNSLGRDRSIMVSCNLGAERSIGLVCLLGLEVQQFVEE